MGGMRVPIIRLRVQYLQPTAYILHSIYLVVCIIFKQGPNALLLIVTRVRPRSMYFVGIGTLGLEPRA